MVDWSVSQGHLVRCHNLIWHNGLPEWLSSGNWTREELLDIMEEHIEKVVTHYRGRCYAWDVVNEVLDHETGDLRSTLWLDTIGEEYIDIAFELAAKYDPEAKLYYNDYGIESKNEKSLAATELVRQLKSRGVKVDGVGLQAHFPVILAPTYDEQVENLGRFGELGVDVAYTELDVFIDMPNDPRKRRFRPIFLRTQSRHAWTPKHVLALRCGDSMMASLGCGREFLASETHISGGLITLKNHPTLPSKKSC